MIRSFKELAKEQESLVGGKGRTLARLYRAGYRVPDGFIILRAAFVGDELTSEAWAQVQARLARMRRDDKDGSFAVRSSAVSEDSALASFAGEFETVLDVRTDEEIRQAIHARNGRERFYEAETCAPPPNTHERNSDDWDHWGFARNK